MSKLERLRDVLSALQDANQFDKPVPDWCVTYLARYVDNLSNRPEYNEPGREPITLEREDVASLLDAAAEKLEAMQDDLKRGSLASYDAADVEGMISLVRRTEASLGYPGAEGP